MASPKSSRSTPPKRRQSSTPMRQKWQNVEASLRGIQTAVVAHAKEEAKPAEQTKGVTINADDLEHWVGKKPTIFTAPDGATFESEGAYKKHMYKTMYSFIGRKGETLQRKPGEIRGQSFDLCELEDCEVQLLDFTGQVLVDALKNCKVYVGACVSDVFIRQCENCTFTIACKQLRVRDCSHCKVGLYSATRPALETSHHMEIGVFNGAYPRQGSHFRRAQLNPESNQWDQVHDYSKGNKDLPTPHWTRLDPKKDFTPWEITLPDCTMKPENPVPRESNALFFMNSTGGQPILGVKKTSRNKVGFGTKGACVFGKLK